MARVVETGEKGREVPSMHLAGGKSSKVTGSVTGVTSMGRINRMWSLTGYGK